MKNVIRLFVLAGIVTAALAASGCRCPASRGDCQPCKEAAQAGGACSATAVVDMPGR